MSHLEQAPRPQEGKCGYEICTGILSKPHQYEAWGTYEATSRPPGLRPLSTIRVFNSSFVGRPQVYLPHPGGLFGARLWRESLTLSQHKRAAQNAGTGCGGLGVTYVAATGAGMPLRRPSPKTHRITRTVAAGWGLRTWPPWRGASNCATNCNEMAARSRQARQSQLQAFLRICAGARGCRGRGRNNAHGCLLLTRGAHSTWAHPTICVGTRVICGHLHRSVRDDFGRMPLVNPGGALDAGAPHAMR